ncbi:MAG: nuclear transport factor 2 family protein [Candidatus Andeanibacterium colombiense]|uniref:Nuclear transport factor 2 family protein n=1 Tax=Candidatus Andeanibacterium colombiense TaxID=3121345 RepID=A0AAJ5X567_9SPHN|nr:MAG: nuclear transport factor 2 family protein [Sphingomonadaceae bacterium]
MTFYSPTYADDRAQIQDLMGRYLFAMDWHDTETYANCFTEDGVLDYAMDTLVGRAAIREGAVKFRENVGRLFKREDGSPALLRHVLDQIVIRIEGDRAWTTAFWWEMTDGGPGRSPQIQSYGTYEDEVVRVGGQWLFSRRKIYNEFIPGRETPEPNPVRHFDEAADAAKKD